MQAEGSQLLMLHEVEGMTRLKKSCLYDLMKKGTFPLQIRVAPRAVRWRRTEVEAYLNSCSRGSSPVT